MPQLRSISSFKGGLGPSSLCPSGVLTIARVIAASLGYDLAVEVWDFNVQAVFAHGQTRNSVSTKKKMCML